VSTHDPTFRTQFGICVRIGLPGERGRKLGVTRYVPNRTLSTRSEGERISAWQ